MKTRGIRDLYLPGRIARHVKFILFCAAFTPIWGLTIKAELTKEFLLYTFVIMIIGMEVVYAISRKLLKFNISHTQNEITWKDIVRMYLIRLVLFYITATLALTLIAVLFVYVSHIVQGDKIPLMTWLAGTALGMFKWAGIGLLFASPIFFFIPWQQSLKREFELREQNLIFQNETLKSQVNPHFLFNSLNTLSSLMNNEVELANRFVGKLSLIYRYILDNSVKTKIALKEEIAFVRDYFYMHQVRSEGKIRLDIDIKEKEYQHEIMPVSLQILVENAIKHNMATLEKPLEIRLFMGDGYIVVENNLQKLATQVNSTKIGLKNLNERIRLLTGKEIIISESDDTFSVKIPLML
ncbi:MAG: sensor histidine kinase [Anaerolineales bacterium]